MNRSFGIIICVSLCFVSLAYATTNFADFQYQVDSFEVTGNLPGIAIDDFDNGTVFPWHIEEPTVTETGGYLVLSTPGNTYGPYEYGGVSWISERSSVNTEDAYNFNVMGGEGDFLATSRWVSAPAGQNEFYGMELWTETGISNFSVNLNMYNYDSVIADALGIPSGLGVWLIVDTGVLSIQALAISQSDITGDVLFRMSFDDDADLITAAFSLDGGATFQSPFSPVSFNLEVDEAEWYLEAEEWQAVPEPATLVLLGLGGLTLLKNSSRK